MSLTPEQRELGRRNFMRALAGTPALAAFGVAVASKAPLRGGPVRVGYVGTGGEGRVLIEQTDPRYAQIVAICDINPAQLAKADESMKKTGRQPVPHYFDWKEMIQREKLEAVVLAPPLFMHTEIACGCLEAGLHVLCEKMMAFDPEGCSRMLETSRRSRRLLEIGHQRFYNPIYQAAYTGIVKPGTLGEVYHARLVWHRNGNWRRKAELPSPDYSPAKWGYPTIDHLINWRLYDRYSRGHMAELASHMVAITDWFFGATADNAIGSGGVYRYRDGREVPDHTYATIEYPGGRTAVFTSIESNEFEHYYEAYYGTRGTLILTGETEAYLFDEGQKPGEAKPTTVEVAPKSAGPAAAASESRSADAAARSLAGGSAGGGGGDRLAAYRYEVNGFCSAIRTGSPLQCTPERAQGSANACITAFEAIQKKQRLPVPKSA
jgi:predicted dehydrogenase